MKIKFSFIGILSAILFLSPMDGLAFKLAVHGDITESQTKAITRTIEDEELSFSEKAITELEDANTSTDKWHPFDSKRHFDGEAFNEASSMLITLKNSVITAIKGSEPDGSSARESLGTALHAIQDFYAHSNWVEIGKTGINEDLGKKVMADPSTLTAFCPSDPAVLAGAGLTDLTSGYFLGPFGCNIDLTAGKCYHGGWPCDGINKDEEGRTLFSEANSLAEKATVDYINQVLDASGVKDKARAVKALMNLRGTLGMVIDDTGSMGEEIDQVKCQADSIVTSLAGTDQAPEDYLLVRFGDPDVGPAYATTDPDSYLERVNALEPYGGDDCPEYSQTALLEAVAACRNASNIYLFTDASAKDSSKASHVNSAAQEKDIKITCLITGSCSPIDPAYISNAEETGGQCFFLSPYEVDNVFDLIKPQLAGDFVTIARSTGSFASGEHRNFTVPIDTTVSRAVFSFSIDTFDSATVTRPDGSLVNEGDPGVTISRTLNGIIITVENPAPGSWEFEAAGSGEYSMASQANSAIDLYKFDFVEYSELFKGYFKIQGQPVSGADSMGLARIIGPYDSAEFYLVDQEGTTCETLNLAKGDPDISSREFLGNVPLPASAFRVIAKGLDQSGYAYQRLYPNLFRAQSIQVRFAVESMVDPLPIDSTTSLRFTITNMGGPETFNLAASNSQLFPASLVPEAITLGTEETKNFTIELMVPPDAPQDTDILLIVTATASSNPAWINSAVVEMTTQSLATIDCGGEYTTQLWPPNGELVTLQLTDFLTVTGAQGTPTIRVDAITQDEPVASNREDAFDAEGVGTDTINVRAERDGDGNGRVYAVEFTATDSKGNSCSGTFTIGVPHSNNGDPAIDDGQIYDSTTR